MSACCILKLSAVTPTVFSRAIITYYIYKYNRIILVIIAYNRILVKFIYNAPFKIQAANKGVIMRLR